jgi:hypothetical protein
VQAYDRSGNGNRGILTNGLLPSLGRIGQGLQFDAVNDSVDLGNPSSLNLDTNFTLSAWVKVNGCGAGALGGVIAHYSFAQAGPAIRADCRGSGNNLTFRIVGSGAGDIEATDPNIEV